MRVYIIIMALFLIVSVPLRWSAAAELRRYVGPRFFINYALALLAATIAPNGITYFTLLAVLFMATTTDRVDAACRYILLVSLLPNIAIYFTVGSVSLFSMSNNDVLGLSAIVVSLAKKGRGEAQPPGRGFGVEDLVVTLLFLIFWLGANRITSFTVTTRAGVEQALLIVLPYVVLRLSLRTAREFRLMLACFAFASVVLGAMAIYESRHSWVLFDDILNRLSTDVIYKSSLIRGGTMRASTTMQGPLALALHLVIAFVLTLYSRDKVRSNLAFTAWLAVIFAGLAAAQSRGNMICLALGLLIFFIVRGRWLYASLIGIAAPLFVSLLLAMARWSTAVAGFLNVNQGSEGDVYDYRQLLLQRGMEEAAKHRWTGASMEDVMSRLGDIRQGQGIIDFVNTYLVIYLVSGLLGIVLVAVGLFLVLRRLMRRLPPMVGQPVIDVRAFGLTAYLLVLVQLSFMSFIDRVPLYLCMALAVSRLVAAERSRWQGRHAPAMPYFDEKDADGPLLPAGTGGAPAALGV